MIAISLQLIFAVVRRILVKIKIIRFPGKLQTSFAERNNRFLAQITLMSEQFCGD